MVNIGDEFAALSQLTEAIKCFSVIFAFLSKELGEAGVAYVSVE